MGIVEQTFEIEGMSCPSCARKIEAGLAGLSGVVLAKVEFPARRARVEYNPEQLSSATVEETLQGLGYGARKTDAVEEPVQGQVTPVWKRSLKIGVLASLGLLGFYVGVTWLGGGRTFALLRSLLAEDGPYVAGIVSGFGVQMSLFTYLRGAMHGVVGTGASAAVATSGSGVSGTAMVACCLHHLTEILPLAGFTGAALFFSEYKRSLMSLGLVATALGILWMGGLIYYHRRKGCLVPATR
ncbi:MAG: cation-translocating P-type ATPase [Candidatus Tectomicrobia bacterium]|uniref:Cation-translocating P-type ATPase n=1 Tax=Tectimicrobiota bacterium TaxID=2528274 RepID=A0A932GR06_UNCTE|nr:cation-translocating P-type ATPase [Candidatus Tectomicrobia bacterium]